MKHPFEPVFYKTIWTYNWTLLSLKDTVNDWFHSLKLLRSILYALKYSGPLLTLGISLQDPNAVIKLHRFDVKCRQDAFLVLQWSIVDIALIGWQDNAHVTEVDVDSP